VSVHGFRHPAIGFALAIAFGSIGNAEAYRFYSPDRDRYGRIVSAKDAARWSDWGPGETLEWTLDTSPDWSKWYGSRAHARIVIEKALEAYSSLPHADISWEIGGEAASDYGETGPKSREDRNWVSIDPNGEFGGQARLWWQRRTASGEWTYLRCSVVAGAWAAEEPPEWFTDLPAENPRRAYRALDMWIHEFGHCLGLDHSQRLPTRSLLVEF